MYIDRMEKITEIFPIGSRWLYGTCGYKYTVVRHLPDGVTLSFRRDGEEKMRTYHRDNFFCQNLTTI